MSGVRCLSAGLAAAFFALGAAAPARADLLIEIDKTAQRMVVTRDGVPLHTWPVSSGRRGYDTPPGEWKPFRMEADHYSREWDDAPMPHSIFFTKQGHAIHGSFETKRLGMAASHGCVRLSPANAQKLFALVREETMAKTQVVITGDVSLSPKVALGDDNVREPYLANGDPNLTIMSEPRSPRRVDPQLGPGWTRNPQYHDQQFAQPRYADPRTAPQYRQPYAAPRGYYYYDEAPRGYRRPPPFFAPGY